MNRYVYPNRIIVLRFAQICLFSSTRSMVSTTGSPDSWHCKLWNFCIHLSQLLGRRRWSDSCFFLFFFHIASTLWYNSLLLKPWPSRNVVSFPMNSMGGSFHFVMWQFTRGEKNSRYNENSESFDQPWAVSLYRPFFSWGKTSRIMENAGCIWSCHVVTSTDVTGMMVNVSSGKLSHITNWKDPPIFHGKTHYFDWAMASIAMLVYQGV